MFLDAYHGYTLVFPVYVQAPSAGAYRINLIYDSNSTTGPFGVTGFLYIFVNGQDVPSVRRGPAWDNYPGYTTVTDNTEVYDSNTGAYYHPITLNAGVNRLVITFTNVSGDYVASCNFNISAFGGSPLQYYSPKEEDITSIIGKRLKECIPARTSVSGLDEGSVKGAMYYINGLNYAKAQISGGQCQTYSNCSQYVGPGVPFGNRQPWQGLLDDQSQPVPSNAWPRAYLPPPASDAPFNTCFNEGYFNNNAIGSPATVYQNPWIKDFMEQPLGPFSYTVRAGWFAFERSEIITGGKNVFPSSCRTLVGVTGRSTGSFNFSLFANPPPPPPALVPNQRFLGHWNQNFSSEVRFSEPPPSNATVRVFGLPRWATFNPTTRLITGLPSSDIPFTPPSGEWNIQITARIPAATSDAIAVSEMFSNYPKTDTAGPCSIKNRQWSGSGGLWTSSQTYAAVYSASGDYAVTGPRAGGTGGASGITSPIVAGGIGELRIKAQSIGWSATSCSISANEPRQLRIFVNNWDIGVVTPSSFLNEYTWTLNIPGSVQVRIENDFFPHPTAIMEVTWTRCPEANVSSQFAKIITSGDLLWSLGDTYADNGGLLDLTLPSLTSSELQGDFRKVLFAMSEDVFNRIYAQSITQAEGFSKMAVKKIVDAAAGSTYFTYEYKFLVNKVSVETNQVIVKDE